MADEQEINGGESVYEEDVPETTGIHIVTRSGIQNRLSRPESGVRFYDETNFPEELQLPEALKDNELAAEVHRQAKRILCGGEANISQRDFDYTKQLVEILVAPSDRTEEDVAYLQTLEPLINSDLTHRVEEQMAFGQPNSILDHERNALGINAKEDEKPFQIRVLEVQGKDDLERAKRWKEITKAHDMFLYQDPLVGSVLYISAERAKIILNSEAEEKMREQTVRTLRHEYRHTQRSAALGKNKRLFRFFEEPLADVISYQYLTIFLNLLSKTTDTIKLGELFDAYDSGDNKHMADCFSRIADAIGPKGLLLLGGKSSSDCVPDEDGIRDLPLAEGNYDSNEWLQLAETILALRDERDADWQAKLEKNLRSNQIALRQIETSYIVLILQFKPDSIQTSDARLVRELFLVLQAEIERRRALGEEGIYDKAA